MDVAIVFILLLAFFSFLFSLYSCLTVKELKGYIEALRNAPVLREYVKEFVPIDNSEEARKTIEDRIVKSQAEFDKYFNYGSRLNSKDPNAKDLV